MSNRRTFLCLVSRRSVVASRSLDPHFDRRWCGVLFSDRYGIAITPLVLWKSCLIAPSEAYFLLEAEDEAPGKR